MNQCPELGGSKIVDIFARYCALHPLSHVILRVHMHVVYHTVLIEFPVLYSRALFMIKFFQVAFKYVIIINRISIMSAKC